MFTCLNRTSMLCTFILCAACDNELEPANILAIGDSVIWWNIDDAQSVADVVADELAVTVTNAAIPGAVFLDAGDGIPSQYQPGPWEWVIMDGGANDLGVVCGSAAASGITERLVSSDARGGAIPAFVSDVRADGPSVVIMGYYFAPAAGGEFADCEADFEILNARLEAYADMTNGVFFAAAADVIDPGNLQHYDPDLIHPSAEGGRLIGAKIADVIRSATSP
ncbi:SGNH/GDSL hydrolase family protein [Cognatiyoonia sp. IB215446]|uniref:SGNH/GDSL hydrolase family protein n=1 Tax=Cognatiyoonia sp. IB215446 TaxID=3097355 RepID=UPI002A0DEE27|nr:SGNH/GDSL hydrolase family protein [Cognatiyoonia sp. IB215446]MDX8349730.1 SGNH/GDSL hydrolase family protein [Cognatiyoonia sp. IB215446]